MANIIFGYKNLCLESGVTFTPSSEHADHDADNYGKAHPESFHRFTTISGTPYVDVDLGTAEVVDIVAPLYTTGSPHRNHLAVSNLMTEYSSPNFEYGWDYSGVSNTVTVAINGFVSGKIRAIEITSDTTASEHSVSWTKTRLAGMVTWRASCYFKADSPGVQGRLEIQGASKTDYARADVNLATGAINSTSSGGGFSGATSAVTSEGGGFYRVTIAATADAATTLVYKLFVLDAAYTESHTTAGTMTVGGAMLEYGTGTTPGDFIDSGPSSAGLWGVDNSDPLSSTDPAESGWLSMSANRDNQNWQASSGWTHCLPYVASTPFNPGAGDVLRIFFHNPEREFPVGGKVLDVSNIYIGPAWQPDMNLDENWSITANPDTDGRSRILRGSISQLSKADAMGEGYQMMMQAGVGVKYSATADGGQEYRSNRKFVLVILDPDESTYAQEQMIYGYLDKFELVNQPRGRKRLEFQITEVLPG